jgi:hypothetical protein
MAERTFNPHPQVLLTEMGDGTGVLLHLETKFYYTLNATGVALWKALAEPSARTAPALAEHLAGAFDVTLDDAARDVAKLLREMSDEGLDTPA